MKYRMFGDYHLGHSHVKNGTGCEDYAASYTDPLGRYGISVACDGHSDKNCFRSAKGARFGCESAIEILTRFFDAYYEDSDKAYVYTNEAGDRLKKSIKQQWDNKVFEDLEKNPITDAEKEPLTKSVKDYYESGKGLQNIYGATFLTAALCDDFFLVMHIGDGEMVCVDENGVYFVPLCEDEKSLTGAPASICDSDLFTRENAFRIQITKEIPKIAVVSSDGVGDSMDMLVFRENIKGMLEKFNSIEEDGQNLSELNEGQKEYLHSFLGYWAGQGHGAEDDTSWAGFYIPKADVPEVKLPLPVAQKKWEDNVKARNAIVEDYSSRKAKIVSKINEQWNTVYSNLDKDKKIREKAILDKAKEETARLKLTLKTLISNENEKIRYYDEMIKIYSQQIIISDGYQPDACKIIPVKPVEDKYVSDHDWLESVGIAENSNDDPKKNSFLSMFSKTPKAGVSSVDETADDKNEDSEQSTSETEESDDPARIDTDKTCGDDSGIVSEDIESEQ